jgi:UDP-N-acetylmuramoyl-tripeptide--D-alanyl-D-alanine ligase
MRQPLRAALDLPLGAVYRALALHPDPEVAGRVGGVATDSRDVQPGDLFVALLGEHHDGHDFLDAALAAGAVGLLVSRVPLKDPGVPVFAVTDTLEALGKLAQWWRRRCGLRLVAVTGSNGKTITKEMIAAVLAHHAGDRAGDRERVLVTPGNFNNFVGLPITLLGASAEMTLGVVELGMNAPGEIDYLTRLAEPEVGLVTNATEAHLERFEGVEGVARAKAELWGRLPASACAVVPADDPRLAALAAERFSGLTLRFGAAADADVRVVEVAPEGDRGIRVTLAATNTPLEVTLPLLGRHNAQNAAAATAACLALGLGVDTIREGLAQTAALPHRARLVYAGDLAVLDDCYNANPASVRAGAQTLADLPGSGRLGAVVGDMLELGPGAAALHRRLGAELVELGMSVVVGIGPLAAALCDGAREAGGDHVEHVATAAEAARAAQTHLGAGDRLLVKGSRAMGLEAVIAHLQACDPEEGA